MSEGQLGPTAMGSLVRRLRAAWVTVALVVICFVAFTVTTGLCAAENAQEWGLLRSPWIEMNACGPVFDQVGALRLSRVWIDGAWWRVISAGFLHGSVLHLVLNTWSLWVVGELAESAWGHARMGVLFGLSSVGGCLASAAWVEAPMVVGASAGIMGVAGAIFVGRLLGKGKVALALAPLSARVLGGWLVVLIVLGFVIEVIAQAGHLGGLLIGLLLGLAWSRPDAQLSIAGRLGVGLALAGLMLAARQPEGRERYYEFLGHGLLERGRGAEAVAAFRTAMEREGDDPEMANDIAYGLAEEGIELGYAEELVRRALEADPEEANYLDTLGWILCRRGEVDEGMEWVRKASELSGGEVAEIEGHLVECEGAAVE